MTFSVTTLSVVVVRSTSRIMASSMLS
jgi:hypothetical protein